MRKNLFAIIVLIALMALLYAAFEMLVPAQNANTISEVAIPKGATFRQAADILFREKLIRDKKVFVILGRLTGADRKIRAGYYSIWSNMSPLDIFRAIRKGRIIEYEIQIIEGDSLPEISEKFAQKGIATTAEFADLSTDRSFLTRNHIDAPSFEGYLYPDTYMIPKGVSAEEAAANMIAKMREKFSEKLVARMAELHMTENQVLTLASIVEKEAVIDSERPVISAVYHNRLKKGMPLQADPTCIYGIKSSREKITRKDLQRETPYNTYIIKGLPPGPIASPGFKSIMAALYPDKVPYLYFVSSDDRSHRFSETVEQHAAAVKEYRQRKQSMKSGDEG